MHIRHNTATYYATDLTDFLGCRHLADLERLAGHKIIARPFFDDPMLEVLRARGLEHEQAYVTWLARSGKTVAQIGREDQNASQATVSAMTAGTDVIVQARLETGNWAGW